MSVIRIDQVFTDNGSSIDCNVPASLNYMLYAVGNFGGGVLALEASPDNGINWFTVDELRQAGRLIRYLCTGERIRITLSEATSPNLTSGIRQ